MDGWDCGSPYPRASACTPFQPSLQLAVALSKYVGEDDPLPLIRDFVRCGGGQTHAWEHAGARPGCPCIVPGLTSPSCPGRQPPSGYAVNGRLDPAEVEIMPDLIALRIFSNVIYFTGRAYAGEDGLNR